MEGCFQDKANFEQKANKNNTYFERVEIPTARKGESVFKKTLNMKRIEKLITEQGLDRTTLAERMGVCADYPRVLFGRAETQPLGMKTIKRLAAALGVEPVEIIKGAKN